MKFRVDKQFTAPYQMEKVKADLKTFKDSFDEKTILDRFADQIGFRGYFGEIVTSECSAFPAGTFHADETHFCITYMTDAYSKIYKLRFYADMNMNVNTDDLYGSPNKKLYTVETFTRN